MSKTIPTDYLQSELRKTFGRRPTTSTKARPAQQRIAAKPEERKAGSAATRERAKAQSRERAVAAKRIRAEARARESASTSRRRTGTAATRKGGNARRKLTCPVAENLYKQLQMEAIEENRPIREIVESMLEERYTEQES